MQRVWLEHHRSNEERLQKQLQEATEKAAALRERLAHPIAPMYELFPWLDDPVSEEEYNRLLEAQRAKPLLMGTMTGDQVVREEGERCWWYLDRFWRESYGYGLEAQDVQVLVLQSDLEHKREEQERKQEREEWKQVTLARARATVFGQHAEEEEEAGPQSPRRKSIPESVRHEVWRRDQGRCVECGSQENLEFDHIIPVSQGGSSTARNLQLLCETCNRPKGATI